MAVEYTEKKDILAQALSYLSSSASVILVPQASAVGSCEMLNLGDHTNVYKS
jgi:hypothetical protein